MKALFGQVDIAVEEALNNRFSKLDELEIEEWNDELLREDAENVNLTIAAACESMGWTADEYNKVFRRIRDNRHSR